MNEGFAVGDMVTYTGPGRGPIECKIVKIMPVENARAVRNYRIRGSSEAFERAVPEFTLTAAHPAASELILKS